MKGQQKNLQPIQLAAKRQKELMEIIAHKEHFDILSVQQNDGDDESDTRPIVTILQ